MPIYEYERAGDAHCPSCVTRFEVFQQLSEEPLAKCPECGVAIHRVLSSPSIHGASSSKQKLSTKSLAGQGFTKYVKAGDGHYEKAAGNGPDVIKR